MYYTVVLAGKPESENKKRCDRGHLHSADNADHTAKTAFFRKRYRSDHIRYGKDRDIPIHLHLLLQPMDRAVVKDLGKR